MPIEFAGSPTTSLGIELELGLVARESRESVPVAREVIEELAASSGRSRAARVKQELFQSTVEVITGVCDSVSDARADLSATLDALRVVTDRRELDLIGSGSHPFSNWRELQVNPEPRYVRLVESIQWPAKRLAIHGVHFHVGVPSGPHALAVVESLTFHLPLFLALSASSPFWVGTDTGMASARTKVFEGLPTAGLPPRLADWTEFEALLDGLLHAQLIDSIREIWWDCRPHPDFGTVELRMCDGITNMDDVAAIAALAQSLVHHLIELVDCDEPLPGGTEWIVRENKWLASRYGIDTSFIVDDRGTRRPAPELVAELVELLGPNAAELGCSRELESLLDIVERGPSAQRQRAFVAQGGSLRELVGSLADEHRNGLS